MLLQWLSKLFKLFFSQNNSAPADTLPHVSPPNPPQPPPVAPTVPQDAPKYDWLDGAAIRHSLRTIGDEYGLSLLQKDLLCDIAFCESNYVLKAKRVNSPKSVDRGLFQWNTLYHPEITDDIAYDPEQATRLACKAILKKMAHVYWSASQHCWNAKHKYDGIL